jgi:hypothetical protein
MDETLRSGNKALDYIVSNYSDRGEKTQHLVKCLPRLAAVLSGEAQTTAETLLKSNDLWERISGMFSNKRETLAECVFDLMLIPCFEEIVGYCGDNELASVFVDALLYQAAGHEPELPTETQILSKGTHHAHGIAKYKVARDYIKNIPDLAGWLFGKEYAAIVGGRATDVAHILSIEPLTLLFRQHARWSVRYFLYGTLPSEDETKKLDFAVHNLLEKMGQAFKTERVED